MSGGLTSTGDQGFVCWGGTQYAIAGPVFQQFKAGFEQSAKQAARAAGPVARLARHRPAALAHQRPQRRRVEGRRHRHDQDHRRRRRAEAARRHQRRARADPLARRARRRPLPTSSPTPSASRSRTRSRTSASRSTPAPTTASCAACDRDAVQGPGGGAARRPAARPPAARPQRGPGHRGPGERQAVRGAAWSSSSRGLGEPRRARWRSAGTRRRHRRRSRRKRRTSRSTRSASRTPRATTRRSASAPTSSLRRSASRAHNPPMTTDAQGSFNLRRFLLSGEGWPYLLVPFIVVAIVLEFAHASATIIFVTSALGVIPTAALMGRATEELAARSGPGIGGFLNVTFGNAPELIIAFFALNEGLQEVVKASLVGSILGNILLVMGAAMLVGGPSASGSTSTARRPARSRSCCCSPRWRSSCRRSTSSCSAARCRARPRSRSTSPATSRHVGRGLGRPPALLRRRAALLPAHHKDLFNPAHDAEDHGARPGRSAARCSCWRGPASPSASCRRSSSARSARPPSRSACRRSSSVSSSSRSSATPRALGRDLLRRPRQDGPGGQHRDRLERPDRPLRRAPARAVLVLRRRVPDGARVQRLGVRGDPARGADRHPVRKGG